MRLLLVLGLLALPLGAKSDRIADAAAGFLATLDEGQRRRVLRPFRDEGRENWHYVPRQRGGIALKELSAGQRAALDLLLRRVLTDEGLKKAEGVILLERVLVELGADPAFRDAGKYHVEIFGVPSPVRPWGWRFEGHHLSLNYTSIGARGMAGTPSFFGANPHVVPRGKHKGLRLLGHEENRGRRLVRSLDAAQKKRAIIADRAPREIVTGAQRKARLDRREGIPAAALNAEQQRELNALIELYVRSHRPRIADKMLARMRAAGFSKIHFAWAGSTEPGRPHYYRVHGPTVLIEYDNIQNGANHSHTVLRDPQNDFGRDWLAEHHRRDHR